MQFLAYLALILVPTVSIALLTASQFIKKNKVLFGFFAGIIIIVFLWLVTEWSITSGCCDEAGTCCDLVGVNAGIGIYFILAISAIVIHSAFVLVMKVLQTKQAAQNAGELEKEQLITNYGSGAIAVHGGIAVGSGGIAIGGDVLGNITIQNYPKISFPHLPGLSHFLKKYGNITAKILLSIFLISIFAFATNGLNHLLLLDSLKIHYGQDGIVVVEQQQLQFDNSSGKEFLSKHEQITRHFSPVIDIELISGTPHVDEDIVRELILKGFTIPKEQTCDLKVEIPPGQIHEYQVEWKAYWQEGSISEKTHQDESTTWSYKIVIGYECNLVADDVIDH